LSPDDLISQVITLYFNKSFEWNLESGNKCSTQALFGVWTLDHLTFTVQEPPITADLDQQYCSRGIAGLGSITSEISGMRLQHFLLNHLQAPLATCGCWARCTTYSIP